MDILLDNELLARIRDLDSWQGMSPTAVKTCKSSTANFQDHILPQEEYQFGPHETSSNSYCLGRYLDESSALTDRLATSLTLEDASKEQGLPRTTGLVPMECPDEDTSYPHRRLKTEVRRGADEAHPQRRFRRSPTTSGELSRDGGKCALLHTAATNQARQEFKLVVQGHSPRPALVSFIGQTGSGKSHLVRELIRRQEQKAAHFRTQQDIRDIINRTEKKHLRLARSIFCWLIACRRSLTVSELVELLAVQSDPCLPSIISATDREKLESRILEVTKGAVNINQRQELRFVPGVKEQLVHGEEDIRISRLDAEDHVTTFCLDYLARGRLERDLSDQTALPRRTTVEYMMDNWVSHYTYCENQSKSVAAYLQRFVGNGQEANYLVWKERYLRLNSTQEGTAGSPLSLDTPLGMCAFFGFERLARLLLETGLDHCCPEAAMSMSVTEQLSLHLSPSTISSRLTSTDEVDVCASSSCSASGSSILEPTSQSTVDFDISSITIHGIYHRPQRRQRSRRMTHRQKRRNVKMLQPRRCDSCRAADSLAGRNAPHEPENRSSG